MSVSSFLQSDRTTASDFVAESRHGLEAFKAAFRYARGPEDEAASRKAAEKYVSTFDAGMPGIVKLEELTTKEDVLGHWRLKLGKIEASLEVKICSKQT